MQISENAQEALAIKEQEIAAVREQYEAMIQKMKSDHSFALNQGKKYFGQILLRLTAMYNLQLEKLMTLR